jgi:hypothetical protein
MKDLISRYLFFSLLHYSRCQLWTTNNQSAMPLNLWHISQRKKNDNDEINESNEHYKWFYYSTRRYYDDIENKGIVPYMLIYYTWIFFAGVDIGHRAPLWFIVPRVNPSFSSWHELFFSSSFVLLYSVVYKLAKITWILNFNSILSW